MSRGIHQRSGTHTHPGNYEKIGCGISFSQLYSEGTNTTHVNTVEQPSEGGNYQNYFVLPCNLSRYKGHILSLDSYRGVTGY